LGREEWRFCTAKHFNLKRGWERERETSMWSVKYFSRMEVSLFSINTPVALVRHSLKNFPLYEIGTL
jgi:hypothetical protein